MTSLPSPIPEYDPQLDPKTVDIFNPSDLWESRKTAIVPVVDPSTGASSPAPSAANNTCPSSSAAAAGSNLYCGPCKKKFNNEATWQNHLKSAKHLANVKAKSKQQQQPASSKKISSASAAAFADPRLQDALKNLQRASTNPTGAVPTLWSLSKIFYSLRRPYNTYQTLSQLVDALQQLQLQQQQAPGPVNGLTPSQVSSTLYTSRLALARLQYIYNTSSLENAQNLILDALNDKWKIDRHELRELANTCICNPIEITLTGCRRLAMRFIDREESRTEPAKPKADPNQCFTKVLVEASNIFRNEPKIRIVLLCLIVVICKYEGFSEYEHLKDIAETFGSMNLLYRSSEAHILCLGAIRPNDAKMGQWHLFMALLLAMEIDDVVRVTRILRLIEQNKQEYTQFKDIQLLLNICSARETYDHMALEHTLMQQISHVALLLEVTDTDLLLRIEANEMRRANLISRIQSLVLVNSFD